MTGNDILGMNKLANGLNYEHTPQPIAVGRQLQPDNG
jgi:hypothetical protein